MKIGFIQGRLLEPEDGHIQEFPSDWKREFCLAEFLGFNHIEWIITKSSFATNPIFSTDCKKYNISSLCADNLVDDRFLDPSYLDDNLGPICIAALQNDINWVTVPLLENSSISDSRKRRSFIKQIDRFSKKFPGLNFTFEAETQAENVLEVVKDNQNYWITYDTGNITSEKIDHSDYIKRTYKKISNVHLKDRTFDAETVPPLSGDTDFDGIFNSLSSCGYNGLYTIQTARGVTGMETRTMKQHKNIFERIYNAANP